MVKFTNTPTAPEFHRKLVAELNRATLLDENSIDTKADRFADRQAVESAIVSSDVNAFILFGYYESGDGGGGLYVRAVTEPVHPGKIMSADGSWWELCEERPSALQFGAVFSKTLAGAVPVQDEIMAGIAYHQARKTGYLSLPAGFGLLTGPGNTYAIQAGGTSGYPELIDFHLEGSGKPSVEGGVLSEGGGTWLVIEDGSNMGPISLASPQNVTLSDFGIHGKLLAGGLTGSSGVRSSRMNKGFKLRNLYIYRAANYGVGLQGDIGDGSYFQHITYQGLTIHECGGDGFDCKNRTSINDDLRAIDITVIDHNVLNTIMDPANGIAGFDARGPWLISNYVCRSSNPYCIGLRFRTLSGGEGGRRSSLTNFSIDMKGAVGSSGISVEGNEVGVTNGTVINATYRGVMNLSASYGVVVSGVRAINCGKSFQGNTPLSTDAPLIFVGCESINPTTADTEFGSNVIASACSWLPFGQKTMSPVLSLQTPGTSSFSYGGNHICRYTIDGSRLVAYYDLDFTPTIGTGSGSLSITVPATALSQNASGGNVSLVNGLVSFTGQIEPFLQTTTSARLGLLSAGAGRSSIVATNLQNGVGHRIQFSLSYPI